MQGTALIEVAKLMFYHTSNKRVIRPGGQFFRKTENYAVFGGNHLALQP
jgi:hypothetical protein